MLLRTVGPSQGQADIVYSFNRLKFLAVKCHQHAFLSSLLEKYKKGLTVKDHLTYPAINILLCAQFWAFMSQLNLVSMMQWKQISLCIMLYCSVLVLLVSRWLPPPLAGSHSFLPRLGVQWTSVVKPFRVVLNSEEISCNSRIITFMHFQNYCNSEKQESCSMVSSAA